MKFSEPIYKDLIMGKSNSDNHILERSYQNLAVQLISICGCIITLPLKFKFIIRTNSKSRINLSIIWMILLLIITFFLESSQVSSLPIKQMQKSFTNSPQLYKYHHHHRHHQHRGDKTTNNSNKPFPHHPKHFHLESLETLDTSGSLSIVTPLDVLRQNMLLEMQKKRLRDAKSKQVKFNQEFLEKIG